MILDPVSLANRQPLLSSKTRRVYQHPDEPSLLIKVHIDRLDGERHGWLARRKDHFLYTTGMLRELRQFVESRYRDYGPVVRYIAPVYGVIETDLGLGLLVAAARNSEGGLAPTLRRLMKEQAMSAARRDKLEQLLQALHDTDLVIGDLNAENIVLDRAGRDDERFVIIDGLGERTWVPLQSLVPAVARRRKRAFVNKMRDRLARLDHGR